MTPAFPESFFVALHKSLRGPELARAFPNTEMRVLNHESVFALPLRKDNGPDLDAITPGLSALAIHGLVEKPADSVWSSASAPRSG